jgi:hypothetical protein
LSLEEQRRLVEIAVSSKSLQEIAAEADARNWIDPDSDRWLADLYKAKMCRDRKLVHYELNEICSVHRFDFRGLPRGHRSNFRMRSGAEGQ